MTALTLLVPLAILGATRFYGDTMFGVSKEVWQIAARAAMTDAWRSTFAPHVPKLKELALKFTKIAEIE